MNEPTKDDFHKQWNDKQTFNFKYLVNKTDSMPNQSNVADPTWKKWVF